MCIRDRAKSIWTRLPILKSTISIGLLFSVAQFWYSQIYVPTTAPPSLTLDAKLDSVKPRGDHVVVEGSVVIHNTSDVRVQVLASFLEIRGSRLELEEQSAKEFSARVREVDAEGNAESTADRHVVEGLGKIVSHGPLVDQWVFFEPDETITVPVHTWVPRGTYNTLFLDAWLTDARGTALGLADAEMSPGRPAKDGVLYLTRLPEAGWLRKLTRGERYLRVEYPVDVEQEFPTVSFAPDAQPNPPEDFDERLSRFYGVSETDATAATSLP